MLQDIMEYVSSVKQSKQKKATVGSEKNWRALQT